MGSFIDPNLVFGQQHECSLVVRQAEFDSAVVVRPFVLAAAASVAPSAMAKVPVKFHVLLDDDGNDPFGGSVDEAYVDQALTILEQNFNVYGYSYDFVRCGKINYVSSTSIQTGVIFPPNYVFFPHMVNVYVNSPQGNSAGLPTNTTIGRLIINIGSDLSLQSTTFTHEFGHHFGLFHTFSSTSKPFVVPSDPDPSISLPFNQNDHPYAFFPNFNPRELVTRDTLSPFSPYPFKNPNCENGGDLICDTPAGCEVDSTDFPGCSFNSGNCNYDGTYVDYNGMPLENTDVLVRNFMSYSGFTCRTEFTEEQSDVAYGYYLSHREPEYRPLNCGNLEDRVEFKGTNKGLDRVSVNIKNYIFLPADSAIITRTITDADGDFDGILILNNTSVLVTSEVKKLGSNSDFTYSHNDWYDGVSTYDIVLMTKHILGVKLLDGYDQIAADVNESNSVTTADIVQVRKLILGINSTFPDVDQPWRYIPEYIPIDNPNDFDGVGTDNPFQYNLEGILYGMNGNSGKAGFDGVKLGDINGSNSENFGNNPPNEGDPIYVNIEKTVIADKAHFGFKVEDFDDILGYQMEIQFDPQKLSFDHTEEEDLAGVPVDFFGTTNTAQGMIYTLWYDEENAQAVSMEDFKKIFTLVFDEIGGNTDGELSLLENIGFRSSNEYAKPKNFAIGENGEIRRIILRQLGNGGLASIQSIPNPFNNTLNLLIDAVEKGEVNIGIFNSMGQQMLHMDTRLVKGGNSLLISETENWPDGIYFITVEMDGQIYTEKVIKKN